MKRSVGACLIVVAGLALGPVSSHAASVDKVREFFQVMGMHKMMTDLIPTMTAAMVNGMKQGNANIPADVPDIIGKVVNETITPLLPQMENASIKLYADNLTDEEVDAALAFYRTPVGQRLLQKLPAMAQQGMQIGQQIVSTHIPELQQRLQAELQKRHPEMK